MELGIAVAVGLAIGGVFASLRLPLPVPHGLAGLGGLIGMFVGGELVGWFLRASGK